ncbi:MAG: adenylyltransferase/cytidyltransferase family protein, partial [Enterobacterales bacterium]|nr:adenylyltransferase/cytidyltransferase family protein [Enterobacterales bacterium]
MKTIITFGTFDIFHVGHLAILQRAKALGDRLVVGVSSDRLNLQKKQRNPIYSESERIAILRNIKDVDDVFLEESLEEKAEYIQNYRADILAMGDDWEGHFDHFRDICEVVY